MKRGLLVLGGLALAAAFAALVALNPSEVEFRPTHVHTFRPMLGVLLLIAFCAGGILVLSGGSVRRLGELLGGWRARRAARAAAQAASWHQEGEAATWSGELDRGRGLLRKAWRRGSGNSPAALALASSFMDTGEYAAAQEVLAAALDDTPDDADLRYALGETLRRRGDRGEAIRMLETLRVRFPRAPRVLISLRELYRDGERWGDAAEVQAVYFDTLTQAARAGEHERLVELRYQAALALPEAADRLAALDAVVALERDFVPGLVSLGDALADAGRADEAMKLWEKAFRSHPRLVFVERLLAHERSAREHERIMALLGKHWNEVEGDGAHLLLARSALATGAFDTAERELRAVAAQDAPTTLRAWAELHHQRGDHAAAWTAASRAADRLGAAAADHTCTVCRRVAETWLGYCAGCGRFDTYRAGGER